MALLYDDVHHPPHFTVGGECEVEGFGVDGLAQDREVVLGLELTGDRERTELGIVGGGLEVDDPEGVVLLVVEERVELCDE